MPHAQVQRYLAHVIEEIKLNLHCVTSGRPNWNCKRLSSNPGVDSRSAPKLPAPPAHCTAEQSGVVNNLVYTVAH